MKGRPQGEIPARPKGTIYRKPKRKLEVLLHTWPAQGTGTKLHGTL